MLDLELLALFCFLISAIGHDVDARAHPLFRGWAAVDQSRQSYPTAAKDIATRDWDRVVCKAVQIIVLTILEIRTETGIAPV
jgi:hypothetical protein